MSGPNEIISTGDMALNEFDAGDGSFEQLADAPMMNATTEPDKGISFHVQMQGYTQDAMDDLIVEAAARVLIGRRGEAALSRQIEERCIQLVTQQANEALATITKDIIDQPLTPAFGDRKPVTMREFIGLTGREYLTEKVGRDGKLVTDTWGRSDAQSRIAWLVTEHMQKHFKDEITKATNAAIVEVQKAVRDQHTAFLTAEKTRLREAIAKVAA